MSLTLRLDAFNTKLHLDTTVALDFMNIIAPYTEFDHWEPRKPSGLNATNLCYKPYKTKLTMCPYIH